MASTRTPSDAFDYCKRMIKSMPLDQVLVRGINRVASHMWMYAPWRWTLASTPTFNLASNTQDYTINYPADWLYAVTATIADGTSPERDLRIVPVLPTNVGLVGQPSMISYPAAAGTASGTVRVFPKTATISGTQTVLGLYKKVMTQFTAATVWSSTMPFDDEWFWVFEEGLLWQAYLFADDRRAGEAVFDEKTGAVKFNGQRGNFEAALLVMSEREPLPLVQTLDQADAKERKK